jgi:hypothetical protein
MFAFMSRRMLAASEALLLAVLLTLSTAALGSFAISERVGDRAESRTAGTQVLVGTLTMTQTPLQADGTHWAASLRTGDRTIPVRISHEDFHRTELKDVPVQVQGSWSADGSFAAAIIEAVDPTQVAVTEQEATEPPSASRPRGKPKTLEGALSFVHGDDFAGNHKTRTRYLLATGIGQTELIFHRAPKADLAGARIRVTGVPDGRRLDVADGGTTTISPASTATSSSTGTHRVAVILFNFSNDSSQPYTTANARGIAFTNADSVSAYYDENSWGQLALTGDVFGWYTIPDTNENCATSTWAVSANAAAAAAGVDLSGYDNFVYAFPSTSCSWAGLANMPGKNSWLNGAGAMTLRVMAHELGHNFGTHHASQLNCSEGGVRVSLSADLSNCTLGEYGDPFSVMGTATRFQHSNFARGNFNWLASGNTLTATSSGDFLLAPVEVSTSTGVSALRVERTSSTWLTLEYRQPYGSSFETFSSTAPVATGVTVRITPAYTTRSQSQLIDTAPGTTSFTDAPLAAGSSFTDPLTGVTITTVSISPAAAVVRISFGDAAPPPPASSPSAAPSATATPSSTPSPTITPSPTPVPTVTPTPKPPSPTPSPTATPNPIDTEAPTAPGNLKATVARSKKVGLTWRASSDNMKVSGYLVYRDGTLVATVTNTKWTDSLAYIGGSRAYAVVAFDAASNQSSAAEVAVQ